MKRSVAICRNRASACTVVRCSSADRRRRHGTPPRPRRDHAATSRSRPDANASTAATDCEHEERRPPLGGRRRRRRSLAATTAVRREAGGADRHVEREHDRPGADREGVGEQRALHRDGGEHAGTGEREHAEELPPVERGTREHEGEHRDREQPPEDPRAVGRRAVGVVPERLRDERDREAGQDCGRHEEAEAEVVVVGDRPKRATRSSRRSRSRAPHGADGEQQRAMPVAEHGPQRHVVAADAREGGDVAVGLARCLARRRDSSSSIAAASAAGSDPRPSPSPPLMARVAPFPEPRMARNDAIPDDRRTRVDADEPTAASLGGIHKVLTCAGGLAHVSPDLRPAACACTSGIRSGS